MIGLCIVAPRQASDLRTGQGRRPRPVRTRACPKVRGQTAPCAPLNGRTSLAMNTTASDYSSHATA